MTKKITKPQQTPEGERLEAVILKHFRSQKQLADMVNLGTAEMSRCLSGRDTITSRFAQKLQSKAGINADYILNGNEPMMLDIALAPIQPKYDGPVPLRNKNKTQHGVTRQYIIEGDSRRPLFTDNGEANVAHIVLGIDEPIPVLYKCINPDYCTSYKYKIGITFIVDEVAEPIDGDVVIVKIGKQILLCDMIDGKYFDRKNNENVVGEKMGVVLRKIEEM